MPEEPGLASSDNNWILNQKNTGHAEDALLCLFIQALFAYSLKWNPKKPQIDGSLCCLVGTITFPSAK